ncbi:MAG: hypothetical protein M3451_12295 [Chloroflexota bacterium]|nr:hypothetical protein [Chloroflexota bacterium]
MTTMTTETIARECRTCDGHGEIVERDSFRGRYYTSTRECMVCRGSGSIFTAAEITEPEPTPPAPATSGHTACLGHPVNAPGFTQDSFTRAMARAFCDDLQITPYHDGRHIVHHRGLTGGYLVTREQCTCKAGCAGTPCKHRAFLISCLDIREPHVRREWAQLNRERPIRKAAAA